MFSPGLDRGYGFGGGRPQSKVPFSSIVSRVHATNMTYPCWHWPRSPDWGHVCKVSPLWSYSFSLFPYRPLWEHNPHLKSGELPSASWRGSIYISYLEFFSVGGLPLSRTPVIYLFIQWFVSLCHYGLTNIYFILWVISIFILLLNLPLVLSLGLPHSSIAKVLKHILCFQILTFSREHLLFQLNFRNNLTSLELLYDGNYLVPALNL